MVETAFTIKFERKPHPQSIDHEVIVFYTDNIRHELCVERGLTDSEVLEKIREYLNLYFKLIEVR
ncbi:MAG: hypothetical protein NDF57_05125 [archaeon GBS-70-058]|nr:hypothetical protein [Candidatus Culexarchaeum nevadense]